MVPATSASASACSSTRAAARGVDEEAARFHARQLVAADQVPRRVGQRQMQRHDIGFAQDRVDVGHRHAGQCFRDGIERDDAHAERQA
jgi:hypothetical protein